MRPPLGPRRGSGRARGAKLAAACAVALCAALAALVVPVHATGAEPCPDPGGQSQPTQMDLCLVVTGPTNPSAGQPATYTAKTYGYACETECAWGPLDPGDTMYGGVALSYRFETTDPGGNPGPEQAFSADNTFTITYPAPDPGQNTWHLKVTVDGTGNGPVSGTATADETITIAPPPTVSLQGPDGGGEVPVAGPDAVPHFGPDDSGVARAFYFVAHADEGGRVQGFSYSFSLNGDPVSTQAAACPPQYPTGSNVLCGAFTPGHYALKVVADDGSGNTASTQLRFDVTDDRYKVTLPVSQRHPLVGDAVGYLANVELPDPSVPDHTSTIGCGDCTYVFTITRPDGSRATVDKGSDRHLDLTLGAPGVWDVAVAASEPNFGTTVTSQQVQAYPVLTGSIRGPSVTTAGVPVSFDATAAGGYESSGYTYRFSADGHQFASGASASATTSFSTAGEHAVSVEIADAAGPAHTITRNLKLQVYPAPASSFTVSPAGGLTTGAKVSFAASASGGEGPYRYAWDFGDGGAAVGKDVSHAFQGGGTFNVSLTVTDANGAQATTSHVLTVTGQRAAGCLGEVHFALTQVTTPGCLVKHRDGTYTTTAGAKVNGLPIPPTDAAHPLVLTPPGAGHPGGYLSAPKVAIDVDGFVVHRGSIEWELPSATGPNPGKVAALPVPGGERLKGLVAQGSTTVRFGHGSAGYFSTLGLHLQLPEIFTAGPGGAGAPPAAGDASVRVDDAGMHLDGLRVDVRNAWIGPLQTGGVCFSYVPAGAGGAVSPCAPPSVGGPGPDLKCAYDPKVDRWDGTAVITLPTESRTTLTMFGGLSNGNLAHLGLSADGLGESVPIVPGVFLERVGLGLCVNPPPLKVRGNVGVGILPAGGKDTLSLDGTALFTAGNPWSLALAGKVAALGGNLTLGSGRLTLIPQSRLVDFSLHAGFSLYDVASVSGDLSGWLRWSSPAAFDFEGGARGCIATACDSADATVSTRGVAGCLHLGTITVYYPSGVRTPTLSNPDPIRWSSYSTDLKGGFGYHWHDSSPSLFGNYCDLADYRVDAGAAAATAAAAKTFVIKPGTRALAVRIGGRGGPPVVDVRGPGGIAIVRPQGGSGRLAHGGIYVENQRDDSTSLLLMRPRSGRWRVSAAPGSAPITRIQTAPNLLPAVAGGAVGRVSRRRYLLGYGYRLPHGEKLRLFVAGPGHAIQSLGVAHGGRCPKARHRPPGARCGHRVFRPLPGAAGRRVVYGAVYRHGIAQPRIRIASFKTPRISAKPAAPKVRIVRRHGGVRVSFTHVRRAARYAVAVTTSNGRVVSRTIRASSPPRTFVAHVGRRLSARATVWGITSRTVIGRPGAARAAGERRRTAVRAVARARFRVHGRTTRVRRLVIATVKGARLRVSCGGGRRRGCPRGHRTYTARTGRRSVRGFLRHARLHPGAKIHIRVTARGHRPRRLTFTVRRSRQPRPTSHPGRRRKA